MSAPVLPPPVEIDHDTKKAVIDGLKAVLAQFQQSGRVDPSLTYQDLIAHPQILEHFIRTFQEYRDQCDSIVRAREGNAPVRDDDQMLACNISLNQIQQLLVRTCAKKVLEVEKTMQTVTETVTKSSMFGLFKKTEQVETQRMGTDPVEERKIRELSKYIAFGWQLPLLTAYRDHLTYQQVMELDEDILALRTPQAVQAVGTFDPMILRKAKQATGSTFAEVLIHQPRAVAGIAAWNRDMFEFFCKNLGDKAWDFFAREKSFFNTVASIDKSVLKIYGDVLCYIATENLDEFSRLNIDKVEIMVVSLKSGFGNKLPSVLSHPGIGKEFLRKQVDNLLHMNQEKDKLMASFALTSKSLVPQVMDWLSKQPKA